LEYWSIGVVEWWSGGVVEWWSGGMVVIIVVLKSNFRTPDSSNDSSSLEFSLEPFYTKDQ